MGAFHFLKKYLDPVLAFFPYYQELVSGLWTAEIILFRIGFCNKATDSNYKTDFKIQFHYFIVHTRRFQVGMDDT